MHAPESCQIIIILIYTILDSVKQSIEPYYCLAQSNETSYCITVVTSASAVSHCVRYALHGMSLYDVKSVEKPIFDHA